LVELQSLAMNKDGKKVAEVKPSGGMRLGMIRQLRI